MLEFCYTVRCSEIIRQQELRSYTLLTRYLICEKWFICLVLYGIVAYVVFIFISIVIMGALELRNITRHFVISRIKPYRNRSVM